MFTIEVKKKDKDEKFSFEDLELFHGDCGGGKIGQVYGSLVWWFTCERCSVKYTISTSSSEGKENLAMIAATAVDGQERGGLEVTTKIIVRQKT